MHWRFCNIALSHGYSVVSLGFHDMPFRSEFMWIIASIRWYPAKRALPAMLTPFWQDTLVNSSLAFGSNVGCPRNENGRYTWTNQNKTTTMWIIPQTHIVKCQLSLAHTKKYTHGPRIILFGCSLIATDVHILHHYCSTLRQSSNCTHASITYNPTNRI